MYLLKKPTVYDILSWTDLFVFLLQANASWYITLIMCQFWHIWFCKTRRVSIFSHHGVYSNKVTFYGVAIALLIMLLCTYVPALQDNVFYTANPPAISAWVPHFFFLAFILPYSEGIKWIARTYPNSQATKYLSW